jgi:4-hydroxy-tetrahydrodipicolinate reductase
MGSTVCQAVAGDPDLELVAAVDPFHEGLDLHSVTRSNGEVPMGIDLSVSGSPQALLDAQADVAVDFTRVEAARENLRFCAANAIHAVVGTTGLTPEDLEELSGLFTRSGCFVAPNFAIGAVLMMRFAELAAPFFETAEVVELHHDAKVDAPSGTAIMTAERMARASGAWAADPTEHEALPGARGARGEADIRVHSLRLRGVVAHQEVLLGTTGQSLSIRHDSYDRSSFMPGVLLAVKAVPQRPGLTVGLDAILDL